MSYSSGPLVKGQTRISSSLGSMLPTGRSDGAVVMHGLRFCEDSQASAYMSYPGVWPQGGSLQRRLARRPALGQLELGDRHQDLGARLQVRGLQQSLLLGRPERRHHGERIDQRLVRRVLDAVPVGLAVVRLQT